MTLFSIWLHLGRPHNNTKVAFKIFWQWNHLSVMDLQPVVEYLEWPEVKRVCSVSFFCSLLKWDYDKQLTMDYSLVSALYGGKRNRLSFRFQDKSTFSCRSKQPVFGSARESINLIRAHLIRCACVCVYWKACNESLMLATNWSKSS